MQYYLRKYKWTSFIEFKIQEIVSELSMVIYNALKLEIVCINYK